MTEKKVQSVVVKTVRGVPVVGVPVDALIEQNMRDFERSIDPRLESLFTDK